MLSKRWEKYKPLAKAILVANLLSVFLLALRMWASGTYRYWFMVWNLILAWVPLLAALVLLRRQRDGRSYDRFALFALIIWLLFLPNCFYMLSDLIHLRNTGEISLLYDALLLSSFIANGFLLGYISTFIVHRQLVKRWNEQVAAGVIAAIFLACGFAIYLGRVLRWNSWDVFLNPAGLLFDVTDGVVSPLTHPQVVVTTVTFFLFIGAFYVVVYRAYKLAVCLLVARQPVRHAKK